MISYAESFAWCMLQVTLLVATAAGTYSAARRLRARGRQSVLIVAIAAVGLLTLMCVSQRPRWNWATRTFSSVETTGRSPAANPQTLVPKSIKMESTPSEALDSVESGATPNLHPADAASLLVVAMEVDDAPHAAWPWWQFVVLAAWAAAGVGATRLAIGLIYLCRYRRDSVPLTDSEMLAPLAELCKKYGIARPVDLRESPRLRVAATLGWRRPVVLLPAEWRAWSADERRAVLAHELAHVRERHFPAWLVAQLALVAHFYHPLVHWLARRLRLEQEIAADALAADAFADRRQYARALAGLALGSTRPPVLVAPLGVFMSRPLLMRRIAMLRQLSEPVQKSSNWPRNALLFVLISAAVGVAGLRAAADDEPQLPPPSDAAQTTRVVAMLHVSRDEISLVNSQVQSMTDAQWKAFCSTQLALLKSDWLLQAALRDPKIAALPMVRSQRFPTTWLQKDLRVGFVSGSEILYLLMYSSPENAEATRQVVDAVVKAYEDEVVFKTEARSLFVIEALTISLKRLNDELARKSQLYFDSANAAGSANVGTRGQIEQQLAINRLDRIESELMRLEADYLQLQTSGKMENRQFYEQRIAQLTKHQDELKMTIRKLTEESPELLRMRAELDQMQKVVDNMAIRLETLEVDRAAPKRIFKIHDAIASDAGLPPPSGEVR
jgi:beta-lactamase regulating signal transducer with metallopeptidase domain